MPQKNLNSLFRKGLNFESLYVLKGEWFNYLYLFPYQPFSASAHSIIGPDEQIVLKGQEWARSLNILSCLISSHMHMKLLIQITIVYKQNNFRLS